MKYITSLFLFLLVCFSTVADNHRSIEWFEVSADGLSDFQGAVYTEGSVLPVYSETYCPEEQATSYSVSISYPVYSKLTSEELKQVKSLIKEFPDTIQLVVSQGQRKKKQVLDLSFIPYIRKGTSFYRLLSFKWEVKPNRMAAVSQRAAITYTTSSVLSSGKWKKLSVTESGLYKLSYEDIVKMGLNPENVQIYGYGGNLLGEDFSTASYTDDLPEVAVWKETGTDSVFNKGDFILFYARGPVSWAKSGYLFTRTRNHYSDKAYYFIGEREGGTLTAETATFTGTPNKYVSSYTDLLLHENDLVNLGESVAGSGTGRELYGEDLITTPSPTFTFNVPDVDTTQIAYIGTECVAHNTTASYCYVSVDGANVSTLSMGAISSSNSYTYGVASSKTVSFWPTSETINVELNYVKTGSSSTSRAFLNYIILNVRKFLKVGDEPLVFRDPVSVGTTNIARFTLENADAATRVFDVTSPAAMIMMNGNLSETSYSFDASASSLKEYVCVNLNGSVPKPTIEGSVANQNLHGYQPDMVIIAPSAFTEQAVRVAEAHTSTDGLSVLVATPEQVYNEFSSGTPDATAYRRLMKLYYDRAATDDELPDYLLLFGGGVYDNRLVSSAFSEAISKSNWLLTYQSAESIEGTTSFVTDDYFGFLDDSEGASLSSAKLDIGVGRFPVHTVAQAEATVDKTLNYLKNKRKGSWKNRLLYLADDGDENIHMSQAESLASTVESSYPQFMVNRIYVDAYKKVTSASGATIPDGNNRFAELLDMGLLMLNYTGHGSTTEWSEEKILTQTEVKSMTNTCLPLWVTATCDFTRYDAPDESGGESAFLNAKGGAIALFTTTRIVYSSNNFTINKSFSENIFSKHNGTRYTLGDIMHLTKSSESLKNDKNKLSFTLIGDPALKLAYPEYSVAVTHVNDVPVSAAIDTFQALSQVTITGAVYAEDGSFASDFNGLVYPTVLDAKTLVKTLGSNDAEIFTYYDRTKVLFSGKDSVSNGTFRFTFVVPKDIQYSFEKGRINLYACDNDGTNEAQGYFEQFALGGTDVTAESDTIGPDIRLFLNDTTYEEGDASNETPTLIARIADESGLNTSGNGIGHDFQLVIDDDPDQTYSLNSYYMADIGSYKSGTVQYVLPEMEAGKHTLSFRAWDVQNNSNTQQLAFQVIPGTTPKLSNLICVRQSDGMLFRFCHDRPDVSVTVKLTIFDLLGREVWSDSQYMQTGETISDVFEWNLTGNNGIESMGGIYVCQVLMTDSDGGQSLISEKIQVLPQ